MSRSSQVEMSKSHEPTLRVGDVPEVVEQQSGHCLRVAHPDPLSTLRGAKS